MEGIDQYTQYGLIILGAAFLIGVFFFKKLLSFIVIIGIIAASAWFFFIK